ncbi:N-acetylmuramidase family protein [uncultured Pseudomonas sp.]|uniref:N-acetylmuramidase family protein n=1 Tax=uncultured Pseudomonas sp. TaxID=114707 RepID=UPI0025971062|nr:N-acetylmuramidase family protein [uncultured Pseudomonas sp.]
MMANLFFQMFERLGSGRATPTRALEEPVLPASQTPAAQPHLSAPVETGALPPVKNWSHPFKDKNSPLLQLTQLSKAASGYYPLGRNGLWHGGVHFDSGTAGILDQSSVQCLADGEVVAYRIDMHSPTTNYFVENETVPKPFSRNFVLVRHRLQPPTIEGSPDVPPSLTFYSLYMHLQDWSVYQNDHGIDRPKFWPEGAAYRVKETVTDVHPGHPGQRGLNVRNQAQRGKVLSLLPRGSEVIVSGEGIYRKLENTNGPDFLKAADGSLRGYLSVDFLEPLATGEYRVKGNPSLNAEASTSSAIITALPNGTEVTVSGEGAFRKLERVNQYVHFDSLEGAREPMADRIVVLDQPIAIKASELIGHIGEYQESKAEHPEKKLHLEVFSGDDVKAFIKGCQGWAQRLPVTGKTWLRLVKGTAVVIHHERINAAQPPRLRDASKSSDADLLVPKSWLDGLSAEKKIAIPATAEHKACNWYRLEHLLHDTNNVLLDGWVREEVGVTPWVNPWSWEGYDTIFNFDSPRQALASFFRAISRFDEEQLKQHGALADASDKGPMKSRLYDIIDRPPYGKITAEELQAAIRLPAHAQSLSQLIIHYESEWRFTPSKWDALDEVLGHSGSTPHLNWLAEKERIKQISWWNEVAPKVGLPGHGQVYHMHPVGLIGRFNSIKQHPEIFIRGVKTELEFLDLYDGSIIEEGDYVNAAAMLGCEVEAIKAVAITETGSSGSYFSKAGDDKVTAILFERHYFHQLTGGRFDALAPDISQRVRGGYGAFSAQYEKMVRAYRLSPSDALKSASWGRFQIMGKNFSSAGYSSVENFVLDLSRSERNHLKAFVNFIKADRVLSSAIVQKDWLKFAVRYNGPAQSGYDQKMRDNYNALK